MFKDYSRKSVHDQAIKKFEIVHEGQCLTKKFFQDSSVHGEERIKTFFSKLFELFTKDSVRQKVFHDSSVHGEERIKTLQTVHEGQIYFSRLFQVFTKDSV